MATENIQFKAPKPMHNKRNQDPNKFCEFHKDIGHNTDDCISLKLAIEKALRDGELTHILKKRGHDNEGNQGGQPKKQIRNLNTHMIQGGPRRAHKRPNYNS